MTLPLLEYLTLIIGGAALRGRDFWTYSSIAAGLILATQFFEDVVCSHTFDHQRLANTHSISWRAWYKRLVSAHTIDHTSLRSTRARSELAHYKTRHHPTPPAIYPLVHVQPLGTAPALKLPQTVSRAHRRSPAALNRRRSATPPMRSMRPSCDIIADVTGSGLGCE